MPIFRMQLSSVMKRISIRRDWNSNKSSQNPWKTNAPRISNHDEKRFQQRFAENIQEFWPHWILRFKAAWFFLWKKLLNPNSITSLVYIYIYTYIYIYIYIYISWKTVIVCHQNSSGYLADSFICIWPLSNQATFNMIKIWLKQKTGIVETWLICCLPSKFYWQVTSQLSSKDDQEAESKKWPKNVSQTVYKLIRINRGNFQKIGQKTTIWFFHINKYEITRSLAPCNPRVIT